MEFPRQEYWSGLLFSSWGNLSYSGIEPASPALVGGFFITEPPGKASKTIIHVVIFSITVSYLISVGVTWVKGVMWGLLTFFKWLTYSQIPLIEKFTFSPLTWNVIFIIYYIIMCFWGRFWTPFSSVGVPIPSFCIILKNYIASISLISSLNC